MYAIIAYILCFLGFSSFCQYDASKQIGSLSPISFSHSASLLVPPLSLDPEFLHTKKKIICFPDFSSVHDWFHHVPVRSVPRAVLDNPTRSVSLDFIPFLGFWFGFIVLIFVLAVYSRPRRIGVRALGSLPIPRDRRSTQLRRAYHQAFVAFIFSDPIFKFLYNPPVWRNLTFFTVQSFFSSKALALPALRRRHDLSYHTRGYQFVQDLLSNIIGFPPLEEQVDAVRCLFDLADRDPGRKPDFLFDTQPHSQLLSPSQHELFQRVRRRRCSHADLIIQGNAGCSKTTLYLALATVFPVFVVVPSNELLADVVSRAAVLGVDLQASTQHRVFDQDVSHRILLVDEVWLLPAWHVRAIFALSPKVVAFGDPYQTNDLGFGQTAVSRFSPSPLERVIDLPTSFTVPKDTMALAHRLNLVPDHYRTLSSVSVSMYRLDRAANIYCPVITGSRECKAGMSHDEVRTIVTAQGARFSSAAAHICGRDLSVLEPSGTFASGQNRRPLLWTLISRHSHMLYLDLAPAFFSSFGFIDLPVAVDNDDILYVPAPRFRTYSVAANQAGLHFVTVTPVTLSWLAPTLVRLSNSTMSINVNTPLVPTFQDVLILDTHSIDIPSRLAVSIILA